MSRDSDRRIQLWQEAWDALPLPMLMTRIGDGHFSVKGAECPFCGDRKKRWGVYKEGNRHFFKCHKPDCPANDPAHGHGEIGYLVLRTGKSLDDAKLEYLRLALPQHIDEIEKLFADDRGAAPPPRRGERQTEAKPDPRTTAEAQNLWHAIWQRLALNSADREKLKQKRGFTDETIDRLGFRSNNHTNRVLLEALAQEIGVEKFLEEGVYIEGERGPRPSGQFFGYGITGKKDGDDKDIWEITEPPIIPYLDSGGIPFYLRPHKGGVSRPKDEFEDRIIGEILGEDPTCAAHVYCPFTLADLVAEADGRCILTEGEFKVAALYQCRIPAIAVPGITFVRNPAFKRELLGVLRSFGVRELIICFDNEVKDDPNFPDKYKPEPTKRWDTQVWAEYAALDLREHFSSIGGRVKIGWLPNELRISGKADFDGVLAGFVHGIKGGHPAFGEHGLGVEAGTKKARIVFREVMDAAREKAPLELFPGEARRIIEFRLQQLFYKPLVASGGDRERKLAQKFGQASPVTVNGPDGNPIVQAGSVIDDELASAFREVRGCYYKRETVPANVFAELQKEKRAIEEVLRADASTTPLSKQQTYFLHLKLSAVFERLRGMPAPITNFLLSCEFNLHPRDGKTIRLVKIRNRDDTGKAAAAEKLWRCTPRDLARVGDFREWMLGTGRGEVREMRDGQLQCLTIDMAKHSYLRDIYEIDLYGEDQETGIWFFGDCAFVGTGEDGGDVKRIEADENNIFWHEGVGYQIDASSDERGSGFQQGAPLMLGPQDRSKKETSERTPAEIYRQLSQDLHDTIGGFEGWIALAVTLAYGAAPELRAFGGNPGNFVFGKMSGGKTTVMRWLMRCWGFKFLPGIRIDRSSTVTGINRVLSQYSSLPVWMDEFRQSECDPEVLSIIRGGYDRSTGVKGIADASKKTRGATALTTPFISGETSTSDAATRSRYAQIHVSEHNRIGDGHARYVRMQEDQKHYYRLGRAVMENRTRFGELLKHNLEDWMAHTDVKTAIPNDRVRHVYGVAYSAMLAMDETLHAHMNGLDEFYKFVLAHGAESLRHVRQETFINSFWRDVIDGLRTKVRIKEKFFSVRNVTVRSDGSLLQDNGGQSDGAMAVLYVDYGAVYNEYAVEKRSRNEPVPLDRNSIDRDLSKELYFMPLPKRAGDRCHRITMNGAKTPCWVLALESVNGRQQFPFAPDILPLVADPRTLSELAERDVIEADIVPEPGE